MKLIAKFVSVLLLGGFGLCCAQASRAEDSITVATPGGAYQQSLRSSLFEPFTKATGIQVNVVTAEAQEQIARLRAMAQTGSVNWDVIILGDIEAHAKRVTSITEDMTGFCHQITGKSLLPGACDSTGLNLDYGVTYLVYNGDKYPKGGPSTWTEFWDTKRFPGGRALPDFGDPWRVMAVALVADGVPLNQLFPLDVNRALHKLDQIKPQITMWWRTGDQSIQGYRSGQYSSGMMWKTRASVLQKEGLNIKSSFDGAIMISDRAMIPKGAPHKAAAEKLLAFFANSLAVQAKHCENLGCVPASADAMKMMSPDAQKNLPSAEELHTKFIAPNAEWINANRDSLLERWNAWVQQ
ncbi:extracellular solute-binding protein [Paraburkholderia sp. BL21I4N1]|uniref:extracellular solute-binding protein n=1 Tax=Paraburkholderia sp. BL21I4N1 TaxID=1938801 RepID=UPI000CFD8D69|nr:extracellular solute-binding protein [Paraburkholderia sp. BL21I4N1]PQV42983.1 mannopine transport system substrate-binding protein [Paraburkholderia sp. BL21I4N1]